jgi:hypothetical protein
VKIDRVIMGATKDYSRYWEPVSAAWRHFGFEPLLVYIGRRQWDGPSILQFQPHREVPDAHSSKLLRMVVATIAPGTSILSDVDMMPMQAGYFNGVASGAADDALVVYSADAYGSDHYPICYLLADQSTWKEIVNPRDLSFSELIESWRGLPGMADPFADKFSDQILFRELHRRWGHPERISEHNRGWSGGLAIHRIDREKWDINQPGPWIDAHLPRELDAMGDINELLRRLTTCPE